MGSLLWWWYWEGWTDGGEQGTIRATHGELDGQQVPETCHRSLQLGNGSVRPW
jgi:hypothetical protein